MLFSTSISQQGIGHQVRLIRIRKTNNIGAYNIGQRACEKHNKQLQIRRIVHPFVNPFLSTVYIGGKRVAMRTSAGVTYLHSDHLGSTSVTSGAQPSSQTYYPYGAVRSGTLPTDYTFTGQRADASDGLMYYGARYYDAGLGRFTQPDTLVPNPLNPQDLNRYAYVRNNPVKYTDPTGHNGCDITGCDDPGTGGSLPPQPPVDPTGHGGICDLVPCLDPGDGSPQPPAETGGEQKPESKSPSYLPFNGTLAVGLQGQANLFLLVGRIVHISYCRHTR